MMTAGRMRAADHHEGLLLLVVLVVVVRPVVEVQDNSDVD